MTKRIAPFVVVALGPLLFWLAASAQTGRGSLSGTVVYGDRQIVPDAPIQVRHKETGAIVRGASTADGSYLFADIPVGVYELSVAMPCCAYDPFAGDVPVRAGEATRFDIRLVENAGGQTLGDDPGRNAEMMRRRAKVPSRSVPRTANGKPDLSGVWLVSRDR